jgi:CIC family chloride channel protein
VNLASHKFAAFRRFFNKFSSRFTISENTFMAFIAVLIGVAAGLGNLAFRKTIDFFHWLVIENGSRLLHIPQTTQLSLANWDPARLGVVLFPMVGGLLMIFFWKFFKEDMQFGFPKFMETVNLRGARLPARIALTRGIASAITLGTGGSAGQESPIAQIGGAIGSQFGQLFRMSRERLKILVACGASAGVAATFNAPIAGVFFGTEIILVSTFAFTSFTPIVIASTVSTAVTRMLLVSEVFPAPAHFLNSPLDLVLYAQLGAIIGLLTTVQIDIHFFIKDCFDRLKISQLVKPLLGGFLVGLIGIFFPQIMGNGYEFMNMALVGKGSFAVLLVIALLKIIATAVTLGSGLPGGLFAPALVIGSFFGGAFGHLALGAFPQISLSPGVFALVGMGAFLAGSMHAPATAIFLVFEITSSYDAILPMMLACVIATAVARWRKKDNLETVELTREGISLEGGREINIMRSIRVREAMGPSTEIIPENMTLKQFSEFVGSAKDNTFFLVNKAQELTGVLSTQDFLGVALAKGLSDSVTVRELATLSVVTVTMDETLESALRKLGTRDLKKMPVVDEETGRKILGRVTYRDLVNHYNRALVARTLE